MNDKKKRLFGRLKHLKNLILINQYQLMSTYVKGRFIIAATPAMMFVNVLTQRSWIESVLNDDEPKWKIFYKYQRFVERNNSYSMQKSNIFILLIVLILSSNKDPM